MKERFNRTYASLPMGIRKDIIAVIDNEPMTWQVCRLEIQQNTKLGNRILKYLIELKLI